MGRPDPAQELVFGPNIADWPRQIALPENLLVTVASAIYDPVTTTDELIPSGETSSYRSNPLKLATFALSRRDPEYVARANATYALELARAEKLIGKLKDFIAKVKAAAAETSGVGAAGMADERRDQKR